MYEFFLKWLNVTVVCFSFHILSCHLRIIGLHIKLLHSFHCPLTFFHTRLSCWFLWVCVLNFTSRVLTGAELTAWCLWDPVMFDWLNTVQCLSKIKCRQKGWTQPLEATVMKINPIIREQFTSSFPLPVESCRLQILVKKPRIFAEFFCFVFPPDLLI